jgi:hypothetical protein
VNEHDDPAGCLAVALPISLALWAAIWWLARHLTR